MFEKKIELPVSADAGDVVGVLGDKEFVLSSMPYVVGRSGDAVVLEFRRLRVFRFRDRYVVSVERGDGRVEIMLRGARSVIRLIYSAGGGGLEAVAVYDGPRRWVVSRYVVEIARGLAEEAARRAVAVRRAEALRAPVAGGASDYSEKLARISWITRLVMKSVLVKNEIKVLGKGTLHGYIEELVSAEKIFEKYPAVYISGDSEEAKFRLLFIGGELRGVYAVIGDKEYYGDDKPLNEVKGLVKLRVYGVLRVPD